MVYLARNMVHQEMTGPRQLSWYRVRKSLSAETLSNAVGISRNRKVIVRLLDLPISMSWTSTMVVCIADRWVQPPIWSGCNTLGVSAIIPSWVTIHFSRICPRQLRSVIGWYALGLL
jgi:hypothetical protein